MHQARGFFLQSLLLIWLGLAYRLANAQSSSCPLITIDDLGSTTTFSSNGLVARGLIPPGEIAFGVVKIRNFTKVCEAAGDRINASSFISVVVEFQCDFVGVNPSLAVCNSSTIVTRQYQFQCIEQFGQPVWDTIVSGSNLFVQTLNPTASLSTPLADQCRRCIDDQQSSRADSTTHCDPCPSRCNQGQGRCFLGQAADMCCNFYLQNNCTEECPSGLVANSNSICVCPSLSLDNGDVSYSQANRGIGSVATYTCNPGYQLTSSQARMTRTCSINGWSDRSFTCEQRLQAVTCRASFNCAGGAGDDLGVADSGESCCLDNPAALAYSPLGSEECIACIVVGFLNASFSGVEQGPGHSVPVGYLKGGTIAGQNLVFNVENMPGTAREGSQFDYTLNTLRTRALANGQVSNVVLTFRVDSIALEPNETFTLTLDPIVPPTPRTGLFFRNTITGTIIDSDNVEFAFTEDDFRANEPDAGGSPTFLPVLVSKSARIASRVELVVVPLTVQEARNTSLPLPPNIPNNDIRSPPFASLNDFNNTNITIIFEPDEDAEINEKSAPIFILGDAINEATEQVFVVELRLISRRSVVTVDLSRRPSAVCRIIDNDPIRIGFELPGYTYTEQSFNEAIDQFFVSTTGKPENGPIYLIKEGNVTSEQTFLVSVQVTDAAPSGTDIQSATFGQDYSVATRIHSILFHSFEQRVPFVFTLLADAIAEGTEAFQASVTPEDTRDIGDGIVEQFPTSLIPVMLEYQIFITIIDDDVPESTTVPPVPATTVPPPQPPPPLGVQGLCSFVVWYSPAVQSCEDIRGYEVRLYSTSPQSSHPNMTNRVGANRTFYMVEEEKLPNSHETYVQVRVIHQAGQVGEWSEGISLGCEKPTIIPEKPPRVYFELNGKVYLNNSALPLTDIGEGTGALYCRTDKEECCRMLPNRFGQFYYPNGVQVPINARGQGFYRNRGSQLIRLNRREGITSPTGTYRCEIPNADDEIVNIYITLTGN